MDGAFNRFLVDWWRFYPDSGVALQNWEGGSGYNCSPLESFVGIREGDIWHDFVAVFVKDENSSSDYINLIQNNLARFNKGRVYNSENISSYSDFFMVRDFLHQRCISFEALKKLSQNE